MTLTKPTDLYRPAMLKQNTDLSPLVLGGRLVHTRRFLVAVTVFRVVWMWVMLSKLPPYIIEDVKEWGEMVNIEVSYGDQLGDALSVTKFWVV